MPHLYIQLKEGFLYCLEIIAYSCSIQQDLNYIKNKASLLQTENNLFISFLKQQDENEIDSKVFILNETITPQINCTSCGNCCKTLLINVEDEEANAVSNNLQITVQDFKANYIEEGSNGMQLISKVPCHFLNQTVCTIYEKRFSGCREFPALHLPQFTQRLFTVFMHYDRCPIIFNVVEALKRETKFASY